MSIENLLGRFVSSKEPGAIVLQGKWGVGKTHFWRKRIVEPYFKKPWRKRYSYVSLFGISSLPELKIAVYQAAKEFDYDLRKKWWRWVHPRWLWWKAQTWLPNALASVELPYIRDGVAKSYNALSFYFVKNRLICFDDIERRGALSLRDFLGLVSQLVDQRNCRVAVILNTGTLGDDQATWDEYKEKVFQGELTYEPSVAESVRLGLDGFEDQHWYSSAVKALESLKVANIRVIQRTGRFIRFAMESAGERKLRAETTRSIVQVLALLTYASAGKADGAPPLDFVMKSGPYALALSMVNREERSEEEKRWLQILSDFGVHLGDELDQALYNMVIAGYPDTADLETAIDVYERAAERQANRDAMTRAWGLYNKSVAENASELAAAFEEAWPRVSASEHAYNLQAVVRVLRVVGRQKVASQFIAAWIKQHPDHANETSEVTSMFGPIVDQELLDAIASAADKAPSTMSLSAAFEAMAQVDRGISDDALMAIGAADVPSLVALLTDASTKNPMRVLKQTLELGDHPEKDWWRSAREKMRLAAAQIAKRSPLSADRMRNFGVHADDAIEGLAG